ELVPVHDLHPAVRGVGPDRGHARLHRARPDPRAVARADDETTRAPEPPAPGHMVVVRPAGPRDHHARWRPLHHERRPRRGLQPQAAGAVSASAATYTSADTRT